MDQTAPRSTSDPSGGPVATSALGGVDRLAELADSIAGAWSARAAASTTVGRERAILRAFGVGGLDRQGRPLAGAVVERWLAGDATRLGSGIALPFAMAVVEYDEPPREIALDIAAGSIDLAMEAKLLGEPDRRATAELEARRLGQAAVDRIDANRTARRELLALLGDAVQPWLGADVSEPTARGAGTEAAAFVRAGADLIRVSVPYGRELSTRLLDLGLEPPTTVHDVDRPGWPDDEDPGAAPAGSQRGLAELRGLVDELAAERRAYVRLGTAAPALSAPEQAVVSAFERVDVVEADPLGEIVDSGVAPDRALADHAFAQRLHARSGVMLSIGPGPLAVAPDMARGVPPGPATLSGRALALQLLAVRLAVAGGLPPASILVGALPDWLLDASNAPTLALAEVAVRRALFVDHPLTYGAPTRREGAAAVRVPATWTQLVAATLPSASPSALVVRPSRVERFGAVAAEHRAAADVAVAVAAARGTLELRGDAARHAHDMIEAASQTLERLHDGGWRAVLGEPLGAARPSGLGADAVAERTELFDPFA